MGRVSHQKPGKQVNNSNGLRANQIAKQRHRHKVVLEDLNHNKHKSLYFRSDPPPGYTFIPAGNPELTAALKEFAKKSNQEIFAVTTTPHASRHELSREVHRIGWHFPTEVVARVCAYYGIRLTASGKLVEDKDDDKLFKQVYQKGRIVLDEKVRDQVTINTEAKQIIRDLFPNIPDNDLFQIIKTAFQLGDGKVGTADEIPLVRRAQLSVVAHVRHTYTDYDKLLRQVPYTEARHRVENETLKRLIDWRGDDEDKTAVEDTLREVVVISDEEESDDDYEDGQILATENVKVQLNNGVIRHSTSGLRQQSPIELQSDDDAPQGFRYVPQVVRRIPVRSQPDIEVARQQSRYAVWDRYRQEYRSAVPPGATRIVERILIEDPAEQSMNRSFVTREPLHVTQAPILVDSPVRPIRQQSPPTYVRGVDGRMYERIVLAAESPNARVTGRRINTPPPVRVIPYARSRPASPRQHETRPLPHRRTISFEGGDGSVVPSIEGSNGVKPSPSGRHNASDAAYTTSRKRHSGGYHEQPQQVFLVGAAETSDQQLKRRRVDDTPASPFLRRSARKLDNDALWRESDVRQLHDRTYEQYPLQRTRSFVDLTHDLPSQVSHHQSQRLIPARDNGIAQVGDGNSVYSSLRDASHMQVRRVVDQVDSPRRLYLQDDVIEQRSFEPRFEADRHDMRIALEPVTESSSYGREYIPLGQRTDRGQMLKYSSSEARQPISRDNLYIRQPPPQPHSSQFAPQAYPIARVTHQMSGQNLNEPMVRVSSGTYYARTNDQLPDQYYRNKPPVPTTYVQN